MKNTTAAIQPTIFPFEAMLDAEDGDSNTSNTVVGLRERKRLELRQHLSDTATEMFLKNGFNNVRISEIAEACNVSEKTIYNHFPVKESLLLDQEQAMANVLSKAFAQDGMPAVDAMVSMLNDEVRSITESLISQKNWNQDVKSIQKFFDIIENTPSVRSYQQDIMDRLTSVIAVSIAERISLTVESPEPQIIAEALIGLWKVQHRALRRYTNGKYKPTEILKLVNNEVSSAAAVLNKGVQSINT